MTLKQIYPNCLTPRLEHDLKVLCLAGMPYEACGLIHPGHIIHQYPNVFNGDRTHGFDMNVRTEGAEILACWHTHPGGNPNPSRDDLEAMAQVYSQGFSFPWIIATPSSITAWELAFQLV